MCGWCISIDENYSLSLALCSVSKRAFCACTLGKLLNTTNTGPTVTDHSHFKMANFQGSSMPSSADTEHNTKLTTSKHLTSLERRAQNRTATEEEIGQQYERVNKHDYALSVSTDHRLTSMEDFSFSCPQHPSSFIPFP